jgi:hypothetical protein
MKYICSLCKFSSYESGNWTRHINSQKHLKNVLDDENLKKEKDCANLKNKKLPNSYPIVTQ